MFKINKKVNIKISQEQKGCKAELEKNIELSKKENSKFNEIEKHQPKNRKKFLVNFHYIYSYLINIIIFQYIILLLPKRVQSGTQCKIILYLGEKGDQQIFSDDYDISEYLPNRIYVNKEIQILRNKKILLESTAHPIELQWNDFSSNLSFMFAHLTTLTSATFTSMFNFKNLTIGVNISHMFYNCVNLKTFTYSNAILTNQQLDATKMFYNCLSLTSVKFSLKNQIKNTIFSSMFYNCNNLQVVDFTNNVIIVNDMREMFYNCYSLSSFNFKNIRSTNEVNTSYLFYNNSNLSFFDNNSIKEIFTNDMRYMFYNCKELEEISLNNLKTGDSSTNMSYAFYNCNKLKSIELSNDLTKSSDMQNMFFNCSSINKIDIYFEPIYENMTINMSRMFFNCNKAYHIKFNGNPKFYLNDLHAMFYNCSSLFNLDINDIFITDEVFDISYLFYNCSKLNSLNLIFSNSLTRNMRGTFQNCASLTVLQLSNFYTSNAEIMWDMFRGCAQLSTLNLDSFDTSKVTDMESMFEGCSNLKSLSLNSFQTSKVQYMNKMFKNCINLNSLDFRHITSTSCGTMHQMFYNCKALKYLNLYNITERGQSIAEMFDGASKNFRFCIKENENIPNIFEIIKNFTGTVRICSVECYETERVNISEKKLCCPSVRYLDNCYDKCPSKTHVINKPNICEYFNCNKKNSKNEYYEYYNYEQTDCITNISGYYMNDSNTRTIDKCHEDCIECKGEYSNVTTNCTLCKDAKPYIYLGNCYDNCIPGFYDPPVNLKCKCFDTKCEICSEDSIGNGLCITCNKDFYKLEDDEKNNNEHNWIDCYKNPDNYFLKDNEYKRCYQSCKYCTERGNLDSHKCISCLDDYSYMIPDSQSPSLFNCYPNCEFYYYFDSNRTYQCTSGNYCPIASYNKLINGTRECIMNCTEREGSKYEFRKVCYKECPDHPLIIKNSTDYFCQITCPFNEPFEIIAEQICVSNCTIMDRYDVLCRTNHFDRFVEVQDKLYSNLQEDITDTFHYQDVNDNHSIILREINHTYEIVTTNNIDNINRIKRDISIIELGKCEDRLKSYYNINQTESLHIVKLDAKRDGVQNPIVQFLVYYPLNDDKLEQLDLTLCEGLEIKILFPSNINQEEADLYNTNSGYFNDICYKYTSDDGTDIPLDIRQQIYADKGQSLCQNGCNFVRITSDQFVECSCNVDPSQPLVSEMQVDKNMLYKFVDIKNIINFDVMKCYRLLLNFKDLLQNVGLYVFMPAFVLFFVCIIIFYLKDFKIIKQDVCDIVEALKKLKYILENGKIGDDLTEGKFKKPSILGIFRFKGMKYSKKLLYTKATDPKTTTNIQNNININININKNKNTRLNTRNVINEEINEDDKDIKNINNIYNQRNNNKLNLAQNKPRKKNAPPIKNSKPFIKDKINFSNKNSSNRQNFYQYNPLLKNNRLNFNLGDIDIIDKIKSHLTEEDKVFIKRVLKYTDTELTNLSYIEALKYDHRTFMQYYVALLKAKHNLIAICNRTDYNSIIIKLYMYSFSFATCYGLNALFFDDDTMHDIYDKKGQYDFLDQAPQIIYSFILSYFLDSLFNYLAFSEEDVINVKHEKVITRLDKIKAETITGFQIKFVFFFILSFIVLIFFWYYVACFCAVYPNTQMHLLKDTLISLGTSLLTPFAICLASPVFRIPSLQRRSKTNQMLYNLSNMILFF